MPALSGGDTAAISFFLQRGPNFPTVQFFRPGIHNHHLLCPVSQHAPSKEGAVRHWSKSCQHNLPHSSPVKNKNCNVGSPSTCAVNTSSVSPAPLHHHSMMWSFLPSSGGYPSPALCWLCSPIILLESELLRDGTTNQRPNEVIHEDPPFSFPPDISDLDDSNDQREPWAALKSPSPPPPCTLSPTQLAWPSRPLRTLGVVAQRSFQHSGTLRHWHTESHSTKFPVNKTSLNSVWVLVIPAHVPSGLSCLEHPLFALSSARPATRHHQCKQLRFASNYCWNVKTLVHLWVLFLFLEPMGVRVGVGACRAKISMLRCGCTSPT